MDYKAFLTTSRERNLKIQALRVAGAPLKELSAKFKLTKQRISQICGVSYNGKRKPTKGAKP